MPTQINIQVIVHSTDSIVEYLGPQADVERLADHLKVQGTLPDGLSMIQVGTEAPTSNLDVPWLEVDGSNNPVALKYHNGSQWVETKETLAVQGLARNQFIEAGSVDINYWNTTANQYKESIDLHMPEGVPSEFKFTHAFKSAPNVHLTMKKSAINTDVTGEIVEYCLGSVTTTGFTIWIKTQKAITEANRKFASFNFQAYGEMEE